MYPHPKSITVKPFGIISDKYLYTIKQKIIENQVSAFMSLPAGTAIYDNLLTLGQTSDMTASDNVKVAMIVAKMTDSLLNKIINFSIF